MHKVSYRLHEATKVCQDLTNAYVLSPEVQELVEKDLFAGMSKDDIKRYCTKKISLMRMKIISACIKKDAPDDVINRLSSAKDKDEGTLELIYTMLQENIDIGTIDSMAPEHDRLLNCLDRFRQGLSPVPDEEEIEGTNKVDSEEKNTDSSVKAEDSSQDTNKSDSTEEDDNSLEADKDSSAKDDDNSQETDNDGSAEKVDFSSATSSDCGNKAESSDNNSSTPVVIPTTSGLSKEDVQELIKGFGSELKDGLSELIKNQESVESEIRKEFEKRIEELSEQMEQKTRSFEDKLKQAEDRVKLAEEIASQAEDKSKESADASKSVSEDTSGIASAEEYLVKLSRLLAYETEKLHSGATNGATLNNGSTNNDSTINGKSITNNNTNHVTNSATNSDTSVTGTANNSSSDTEGKLQSEAEYDNSGSSKVIQFTNRTGSQYMTSEVECSRRKSSGITALAAALGCKKRSRKSMMKMAISGELSKEQLVHIVEAIRQGLTEEQLCQLIENKVPAEKMPQIIEIAVLENKMGYSA